MGSKWKPAVHHGKDSEEAPLRMNPLLRLRREDEERKSLVESEADSDDDILQFDDEEPSDIPAKEEPTFSSLTDPPPPYNLINTEPVKPNEDLTTLTPEKSTDVAPKPASKWGKLMKPEPVINKENEKTEPQNVSANSPPKSLWERLKENNPPENGTAATPKLSLGGLANPDSSQKQASAWGRLKQAQGLGDNEIKREPPTASIAPGPASTGQSKWAKLRANTNNETNNGPKLSLGSLAGEGSSTKQVSAWGRLRQSQGLGRVPSDKPMNMETPSARNLDNMANAAYAVHATQKVTGVLKDKAKESISIKQKLALKERMAKLVAERLTIKQIFKRYVETSTLHGFCYVCSDTFLIRRAIWAILMILGAVYFLIKLHDGIIHYLEYPFTTLASIEYVPQLLFPAMTFCPINPFKLDDFNSSILYKIQQASGLPISSNWTDPGFDVSGADLHQAILNNSYDIKELVYDCDWVSQDTDHPLIPHRDCGPHNFTKYISERGEVCFTVNSGKHNHPLLKVNHSGLGYGYELLFDLNAPGSLLSNPFNGVRIILHDQAEPPINNDGFILTPGFKSFVRMERTEVYIILSENYSLRTRYFPQ
jgi:Amiloride-sensitive sodium channel.